MSTIIEGIIFDLDQALIESSTLEPLRDARKWNDVLNGLDKLIV